MNARSSFCAIILSTALAAVPGRAQTLPEITTLAADLEVPPMTTEAPAAGRRVRQAATGWETTGVHHALYLPRNWKPGGNYPVLVEYQGNGGFRNDFGDTCDGTVEACKLGYGISGGIDYLWISMPFVQVSATGKENQPLWWGDADETAAYCVATVREVCRDFGGDAGAVLLCGFSRGSIAANYLGLRNDAIAALWRGFICHSHYDGVRTGWPYREADRASALVRLQRLKGRPQFISHEGSVAATRDYLASTGIPGDFTFADFAFRNHTDLWALRDCALRRSARAWLREHGLPAP